VVEARSLLVLTLKKSRGYTERLFLELNRDRGPGELSKHFFVSGMLVEKGADYWGRW